MNARRIEGKLHLQFNAFESHFLHRVLKVIVENYKASPSDLDVSTAEAWYSTRGCLSAKMSAEEIEEWLAALHQVKSGSLRHLEDWVAALAAPGPSPHRLTIDLRDVDVLLRVINDYRLMTAARQQLDDADTHRDAMMDDPDLPPARRAALLEIDLLAWLMEIILAAASEA